MRHLFAGCFLAVMLFGPVYAEERATITCDPDSFTAVPPWREPSSAHIAEQLSCAHEVSISHLKGDSSKSKSATVSDM